MTINGIPSSFTIDSANDNDSISLHEVVINMLSIVKLENIKIMTKIYYIFQQIRDMTQLIIN